MFEINLMLKDRKQGQLPGPSELISGDSNIGYYGTVPASEFITGSALASTIALTAGTLINSDTDWLKFSYKEQVLYVPKMPIRVHLSWDNVGQVNAITGSRIIAIKGRQYRIRLMRGSKADPYTGTNDAADAPATVGSEYNDLMYRVCTVNPPSQTEPDLASFTPQELGMYTPGGCMLCMELSKPPGITGGILCRGNGTTNMSTAHSPSSAYYDSRGWRPVLVPV